MKFNNYLDNDSQKREKFRLTNKSKIIRDKITQKDDYLFGRVLSVIGKDVIVEESETNIIFNCVVSGRISSPHNKSTIVCVGDFVDFIPEKSNNTNSGRIIAIKDRIRKFSRKMPGKNKNEHVIAANFNQLLLFFSVFDPIYNRRLIDRLLIAAEIGMVKPAICINKIDLIEDDNLILDDLEVYNKLGIDIFLISVYSKINLKSIENYLNNNSTLIFGPSGVGKSTLINYLIGQDIQKVSYVSERTGKGLHTTSFVKLINLNEQSTIIDSPGIREFGLWDIDRLNLSFHFHEFDNFYPNCKFKPCTHIHEPNCAVIKGLEDDLIDLERYESYINIYNTIDEFEYL